MSSSLAFLVPNANMVPHRIVVTDDEPDALDAPVTNELACSAVKLQPVKLGHYRDKAVSLTVEHIADLTFPLADIQSSHIKSLVA